MKRVLLLVFAVALAAVAYGNDATPTATSEPNTGDAGSGSVILGRNLLPSCDGETLKAAAVREGVRG